jgi:hypothetical protein
VLVPHELFASFHFHVVTTYELMVPMFDVFNVLPVWAEDCVFFLCMLMSDQVSDGECGFTDACNKMCAHLSVSARILHG